MKFMVITILTAFFLCGDIYSSNTHLGPYRWRNDDGDVYTATWKDSVDTPVILTDKENIRLRFFYEIHDPDSINISLGYTEDLFDGPRIPITRSDTGTFHISQSPYLSDTAIYFNNKLMPLIIPDHYYKRTITFDSSESYRLISKDTGSIYELEYSIKPALNIKPSSACYFFVFENGQPLLVDYNVGVLLTPPVSWAAQSFENKYGPSNYYFQTLSFFDENTGVIIGSAYNKGIVSCIMLRTTNGGKTWIEKSFQPGKESWLNSACFISAEIGTVVGSNGTILRTTNGGDDWVHQNSGTKNNLTSVFFSSADSGTVIGSDEYFNLVLRTTDGGKTWTKKYIKGDYLGKVYFPDLDNGYIVGPEGTIVKTTDGGENWKIQRSGLDEQLFDVFFTDKNNGAAVGYKSTEDYPFSKGVILRTTDGGSNWIKALDAPGPPLYAVHFINKSNGWAAGNLGRILKTTDGGINWIKLVSGVSSDLWDVQFVNENCGWAVGSYGKILKTNNGGIAAIIPETRNENIPKNYCISQNYPNPFNPETKIRYSVPQKAFITIAVYNVLGKEVARLISEEKPAGNYELKWNAGSLPSGVYFYQIRAGDLLKPKRWL